MERKIDSAELKAKIVHYNNQYRKGTPEISDLEYDRLLEQFLELSPDDEMFFSGIIEEANDRMEALPSPMYSLEKIKEAEPLRQWLAKMRKAGAVKVVFMPKFDGISLVVEEGTTSAWTRGDGEQGQRCDIHFIEMRNGLHSIPQSAEEGINITWGEAICSRAGFEVVRGDSEYKNARNMVAGIFNSPTGYTNNAIHECDYVRYGCSVEEYNKIDQLRLLTRAYKKVTDWEDRLIADLLELDDETLLKEMDDYYRQFGKEYRIDGVVIEVNEAEVRHSVGRLPNNNPAYSIAFKREEWCDVYETTVESIEWNVSKEGVLAPVLNVKPVEMDGATVSRVTGYNARYIKDNNICVGADIEIIRSGDVIPKHIRTLGYPLATWTEQIHTPVKCPSCGQEVHWDGWCVNYVCTNPECRQRNIAEITYFFRSLELKGVDEASVRTLYDAGYKSVGEVIAIEDEAAKQLFGEKRGTKFIALLESLFEGNYSLAQIMTAYNVFKGQIAEKTAQLIIDNFDPILAIVEGRHPVTDEVITPMGLKPLMDAYLPEICKIKGVAETSAQAFIDGYVRFRDIPCAILLHKWVQTPKVAAAENQMRVCMTGFRSKELEQALTAQGHEVLSGVTGKCTVLVVADMSSTSSKMQKAQKMGIRIVDRQTFEKEVLG